MKLIIKDNYDAMSDWAAQHIADAITIIRKTVPSCLVSLPALHLSEFIRDLLR